jgi:hypothetical protein
LNGALKELMSFAENSYIRMEAEQVIEDCLASESSMPFDRLLEELVLAGTTSLYALWEILEAIRAYKTQLGQEGLAIRQEITDAFFGFGIQLPADVLSNPPDMFRQICGRGMQKVVRKEGRGLSLEDEYLLEDICSDAASRVTAIARRLAILNSFEASVMDWIDGLVYQAAHQTQRTEWGRGSETIL